MIKAYIAFVWPGSATRYNIGGAEARGASHKSWLREERKTAHMNSIAIVVGDFFNF